MEVNVSAQTTTVNNGTQPRFDPNFIQHVINATGPKTFPRMREVMSSLIRHLHDFAREIELTVDEWMLGVELINWAGQMSNEERNEGQLVCDVIGLESLVDEITVKKASDAPDAATQSAILGPFFRAHTPMRKMGESISHNTPKDGQVVFVFGKVKDCIIRKALPNASIQVWEASTNGLYSQQDEHQIAHNLHGKFVTGEDGEYAFYCLRPTPYPVPNDGPAAKLLELLDRHPYRPAHIHLTVIVDGYKPVTTQIFDKTSKYLDDDSVFAVKDSLLVDFVKREGDRNATLELEYDIAMISATNSGLNK